MGSVVTRIAAKKARNKGTRVIYTAHGFHFYKGAPTINWLLYYPVEKWLSRYTDVLITINREDYERAKTFKAGKVCYIPGVGVDLKKFAATEEIHKEKRRWLCTAFGIPNDATILLSVGEVNKNKNHRIVIEALGQLGRKDIYYVICGCGPLTDRYKKLSNQLNIGQQVILAGYRMDIADFYKAADIFVFPSFREGLPVSVMEAMASGLPVIATRIRGSSDIIKDKENGILLEPSDVRGFADAIKTVCSDKKMICKMAAENVRCAKGFDLSEVMERYKNIYIKA